MNNVLAHSQHLLQVLLDNTPALIAYYERTTVHCVFANQAYALAYGKDAQWCVGKHCRDIIGERDWQSIVVHVNLVLNGQTVRYEREINIPGVPRRYVEVNLLPHRMPDGEQVGAFVLINDITVRHVAELDVRERQARAVGFVQATTEGILFYKDQEVLDCNTAFENMLQIPREQLMASAVNAILGEANVQALAHPDLREQNTPLTTRLPRAQADALEVEIFGSVTQMHGQPASVAVVRDISRITKVTESLLYAQSRYRALVENADQVIIFAQDRKVAYANPAALRFFKMDAQALHGQDTTDLVHPEDRGLALEQTSQVVKGQPGMPLTLRTLSPPSIEVQADSVVAWVKLFGAQVQWEGRDATLFFITDMTAQHDSQEQMRKALDKEKELGELKTRFVSMASHEFRTPLATIQTSSELLQHYSERLSTEQRDEAIADIQQSVQRLQAMMDNFLSLGRLHSAQTLFQPGPKVLMKVVHSVIHGVEAVDGHQHLIELQCGAGVNESTQLVIDEILLRQMLENLLSNACKYSDFGASVRLTIAHLEASSASCLQLRVSDNGMGIPETDIPHLFQSFHRASNVQAIQGTGLGLAIVQRAVQAHGGTVQVRSVLGKGSEFELLLPWVDA